MGSKTRPTNLFYVCNESRMSSLFPFVGDECPTGHYCIAGSSAAQPCSPGTFLPSTRSDESADCISCTAGKYCSSSGQAAVQGNCDAGMSTNLCRYKTLL